MVQKLHETKMSAQTANSAAARNNQQENNNRNVLSPQVHQGPANQRQYASNQKSQPYLGYDDMVNGGNNSFKMAENSQSAAKMTSSQYRNGGGNMAVLSTP